MSDKRHHPPKSGYSTTLVLNYPSPPLTLNGRMHRLKVAEWTRILRRQAAVMARDIPFMHHIDVTLTWVVNDHRKRDSDNPIPTLKALCDGLIDADIVPDDTPQYMTKHMPVIEFRAGAKPHLELTIVEVQR